jgi:circadian clock protein KaiB
MKRQKVRQKRNPRARKPESRKMFRLSLFVTGQTPRSVASLQNLRKVCEEHLAGRFELTVIDIYQQPKLAREAHIIAVPTLVKSLPLPLRTLVGDLSDRQKVLLGLDIKPDVAGEEARTDA